MNQYIIPKNEYFDGYILDPEILDQYCIECLKDPKCLRKIRRDFENNRRSFLREDYPDKVIEGVEIIDNNKVKCWYQYDDNNKDFIN